MCLGAPVRFHGWEGISINLRVPSADSPRYPPWTPRGIPKGFLQATNPPQIIHKRLPEPRPPAPPPSYPKSTNAPPFARRPPPETHFSICESLMELGLVGAAPATVCIWFVVGLWSACARFVVGLLSVCCQFVVGFMVGLLSCCRSGGFRLVEQYLLRTSGSCDSGPLRGCIRKEHPD